MARRAKMFSGWILAATGLLALGGCMATAGGSPPSASSALAVASPPVHAGGGPSACALPIAEFEAIIDADNQTGNVNASVYRRMVAELAPIKSTCAAGQVSAANSRLAALKSRHGYR